MQYTPGSLVRARGREWIVLMGSGDDLLRLRPLSGSEEDVTLLDPSLEFEPVTDASFPAPDPAQVGSHGAAMLLRDALLLSLRRGAGPFRAVGQIAIEPRAYQLVPLLMALKQEVVRLLVADDVGIGKTIEAALIAREMLDRGEVDRFTVICPPHLVDQWTRELELHFNLRAVPVTAQGAARLERSLPVGENLFNAFPFTVVSLDYIKSEQRRGWFLQGCPSLVIVDEAHTCAGSIQGQHKRYELLRALADNPRRHMVLLTATPHSGDEAAFYRLLGLLDREFLQLQDASERLRPALREKLARHFVQRRRPDILEWESGEKLFPRRLTTEITYKLSGAWETFFHEVLKYCAAVISAAGDDTRRQRLNFWGTLALMRCVASSPAAAVQALRTRAGDDSDDDEHLGDRVFDGTADRLTEDDVEPAVAVDDPALAKLIAQAESLAGQSGDPKLKKLTEHLDELIRKGCNPVVFCRYIATARYLGRCLQNQFRGVTVAVVTGDLTADERKEKIEALDESERRLLIATDCLSEGINLQDSFDAVVHYDLSWNPTRHEQREGRVDRFGQEKDEVRTTLLYGANNPVDGAVLEVILRKAEQIRKDLGVPVPLPDEGHTLTQALMRAVMLRGGNTVQLSLDFSATEEAKALDARWKDAADRAKLNRTVFAQRKIRPDEVLGEWKKALAAIGGAAEVQRFVDRALARLGAALEPLKRGARAPLAALPEDVRERLDAEGLRGTVLLGFTYPAPPRCRYVHRSHPLVAVLAESLLERTLGSDPNEPGNDPAVLGRVGAWESPAVKARTTVALLRLRHQLTVQSGARSTTLFVEEAAVFAWVGASASPVSDERVGEWLMAPPSGDPASTARARAITRSLELLAQRRGELDAFAELRAKQLLQDHRDVREASDARGSYQVKAILPPDVIGLFSLLPAEES
jgi:superfamily II DNA or RNA helicase